MNVPTARSMKMRFPEFVDVDDAAIEFAIAEASRSVDDSWLSADQATAISYLAAHIIAVAKVAGDNDGRTITSETIGRLSTTYSVQQPISGTSADPMQETAYGRRFAELCRRNNPPVVVV